jgi:hypothetical protein
MLHAQRSAAGWWVGLGWAGGAQGAARLGQPEEVVVAEPVVLACGAPFQESRRAALPPLLRPAEPRLRALACPARLLAGQSAAVGIVLHARPHLAKAQLALQAHVGRRVEATVNGLRPQPRRQALREPLLVRVLKLAHAQVGPHAAQRSEEGVQRVRLGRLREGAAIRGQPSAFGGAPRRAEVGRARGG